MALALMPRNMATGRGRQNRTLGRARRKWVLHKNVLVKGAFALGVLAVFAAGFHFRDSISVGISGVHQAGLSGLASAGLGVSAIEITGQAITSEKQIAEALALTPATSILGYDVAAARERLLELPAIAEAHVRKVYPNHLAVSVVEKPAVARWRVNGTTFLIDGAGEKLGVAATADGKLPLVIGVGAADNAFALLTALDKFPDLTHQLAAVSRIADRRWDLLYDTGLRVQLPENGLGQALEALNSYEKNDALLERDLTLIDMRVPGTIAVRLAAREQANAN